MPIMMLMPATVNVVAAVVIPMVVVAPAIIETSGFITATVIVASAIKIGVAHISDRQNGVNADADGTRVDLGTRRAGRHDTRT